MPEKVPIFLWVSPWQNRPFLALLKQGRGVVECVVMIPGKTCELLPQSHHCLKPQRNQILIDVNVVVAVTVPTVVFSPWQEHRFCGSSKWQGLVRTWLMWWDLSAGGIMSLVVLWQIWETQAGPFWDGINTLGGKWEKVVPGLNMLLEIRKKCFKSQLQQLSQLLEAETY